MNKKMILLALMCIALCIATATAAEPIVEVKRPASGAHCLIIRLDLPGDRTKTFYFSNQEGIHSVTVSDITDGVLHASDEDTEYRWESSKKAFAIFDQGPVLLTGSQAWMLTYLFRLETSFISFGADKEWSRWPVDETEYRALLSVK